MVKVDVEDAVAAHTAVIAKFIADGLSFVSPRQTDTFGSLFSTICSRAACRLLMPKFMPSKVILKQKIIFEKLHSNELCNDNDSNDARRLCVSIDIERAGNGMLVRYIFSNAYTGQTQIRILSDYGLVEQHLILFSGVCPRCEGVSRPRLFRG